MHFYINVYSSTKRVSSPNSISGDDLPAVQRLIAHQHVQEGGLANPVAPDDTDAVSLVEHIREVVQNFRGKFQAGAWRKQKEKYKPKCKKKNRKKRNEHGKKIITDAPLPKKTGSANANISTQGSVRRKILYHLTAGVDAKRWPEMSQKFPSNAPLWVALVVEWFVSRPHP